MGYWLNGISLTLNILLKKDLKGTKKYDNQKYKKAKATAAR